MYTRTRMLLYLTSVLLVLLTATSGIAHVPATLNYQGRLLDDNNQPVVDGSYQVIFTIYDAATGGNSKWTETQTVNTVGGLFSVQLGSTDPLVDTVFSDSTRYLGIKVGSDPEIIPRTRFTAAPYAFRVSTIDGSSGGTVSGKLAVGINNSNPGNNSFVAGANNTAYGLRSSVAGGDSNYVSGTNSAILGGRSNTVTGGSSIVGGGALNTAGFTYSAIMGGVRNTANGNTSAVFGGDGNHASGGFSFVGGGLENISAGLNAFVGGGWRNYSDGLYATVVGGYSDSAFSESATIVGGGWNSAEAENATIVGGSSNTVDYRDAAIVGGEWNTASGDNSVIVGGYENRTTGIHAVVVGGWNNLASGGNSTVGGGVNDTASGIQATVGGGRDNHAAGASSCIPGGYGNYAGGIGAFALGLNADAFHDGSFVWSDSGHSAQRFASTAKNQFLIRANGGVGIGTNAPQTALNVVDSGIVQIGDSLSDSYVRLSRNNLAFDRDFKSYIGNQGNGYLVLSTNGLTNNHIVIDPGGDVGMGTDGPLYKLDVRGTIGNNGILYHSDRRWKENVVGLGRTLDRVAELRGVSFEWDREDFAEMNFPEGRHIGLIAQEVEKVYPELVHTNAEGYKSVEYANLVAVLVEAVKELKAENQELREDLNEIKSLMNRLVETVGDGQDQYGLK